jgi:murein DD-endopeptidase MepM/ murein hydrolase activator NlpD
MISILISAVTIPAVTNLAPLEVCLPTGNDSLFRPGAEEQFFQSTVMGTWESGQYGCVRKGKNGPQFHEGVDIKCLQRDRKGEPTDPVYAVADGAVAFLNAKAGQSNYGRYVILRHQWHGIEVFTLYAHLREIVAGLKAGQPVANGQTIGTLGRSANTREGISRDRAHLHFEINFLLNEHFHLWYPKKDPQAPDFGNFNGQNFLGIDPVAFFRAVRANASFHFHEHLRQIPEAFRVLVPPRPFPWMKAHPETVQPGGPSPAAFEVAMSYTGLPLQIIPREAGEIEPATKRLPALRSVNEDELARNNCRYLVRRVKGNWVLSEQGRQWIELLTYTP